jgi:hypothetical protein
MISFFFRQQDTPIHKQFISILSRQDNQPIQSHIDQILIIVKQKEPSMALQVWEHILEINKLLENTEPWSSLSKIKFLIAKEQLESYILSLIHPLWITNEMITNDKIFCDKTKALSSLINREFIDDALTSSQQQQQLISNAIDELHMMDLHSDKSPIQLLYHIHECCNSLVVALKGSSALCGGADGLVSSLIYVIVHAKPQHLISICQWIEEWCTPDENRSGELFCMYTNFFVAISYIYSLEPESSLIKVELNNDSPPDQIAQKISQEEYLAIINPIRNSITSLKELDERAKGAGIGATIGAVITSPIAIILSMMTSGLGIPMSIGLITTGAAIGSTIGAFVPLNVRKTINDITYCVNQINDTKLRIHDMSIINPFVTNHIYLTTVRLSDVKFLEFVVKSLKNST